jgi:hypothetical protein
VIDRERFQDAMQKVLDRNLLKDYDEAKHPRDPHGRWASGDGGERVDPEDVRVHELRAQHLSSVRAGIDAIISDDKAEIDREIENHRKRIPSDYQGMLNRGNERRQKGYRALLEIASDLQDLHPKDPADVNLVGRMMDYIKNDAKKASERRGSEAPWDEEFQSLLDDAVRISEKVAAEKREASMPRKSIREVLDDACSNALAKEGTSEGAVRGWETRRGGAAPAEETPKNGQDYLKQMGRRLSVAQDLSGRMKRILDSGKKITDVMDKKEIESYSDSLRGALDDVENVFTRVKNPSDTVYENLSYAKGSFDEADKKPPEDRAVMLSTLWRPVYNLYRQGMELAEQGWDEKKNKAITKEGTSEGAKKGWETRREGAAPEDPKGGKTYPVIYRPGGKGTWGEVRQVTVPPREDEPEKAKEKEDLHVVVRPPIPSKRGANRNVMAPTGEN